MCGFCNFLPPCDLTNCASHGTLAKLASDTVVSEGFREYKRGYKLPILNNKTLLILNYYHLIENGIKHNFIFKKVFFNVF